MKIIRSGLAGLTALLMLPALSAHAAQVTTLSVQFGTNTTKAQAGFANLVKFGNGSSTMQAAALPSTTVTTDQGNSVGLAVTAIPGTGQVGMIEARNRATANGAASFAYPDSYNLLTSFLFNDSRATGNMAGLSFTLTDLAANQNFAVTVFSYDPGVAGQGSHSTSWSITGNSSSTSFAPTTIANGPASFVLNGRSDTAGSLTFSGINTGNGLGVLANGFQVVATPEPSTLALAGCGLVGLGCFASVRRNRRGQ